MSFVGLLLMWSALQHPGVTTAARGQQAAGYGHSWGASFGTAFNDEGRALAVAYDGTVFHATAAFNFTEDVEDFPMTLIRRHERDGAERWSVAFTLPRGRFGPGCASRDGLAGPRGRSWGGLDGVRRRPLPRGG